MMWFINWSSREVHPWGLELNPLWQGGENQGSGQELCPQPERQLSIPGAQEGDMRAGAARDGSNPLTAHFFLRRGFPSGAGWLWRPVELCTGTSRVLAHRGSPPAVP